MLSKLTTEQRAALRYNWLFWARDKQIIPDALLIGDKRIWLILAGRGFGKTRTAVESVRWLVDHANYSRVGLIGRTAADVRDVIIQGESGLQNIYPPWEPVLYQPSVRRVTFANGAMATTYTAEKPDQLRGPQHDLLLMDELAAWQYEDAYHQAQFGLRLGDHPLTIIATTPRPTKLIKQLINDPQVVVTTGTTFENLDNLAPTAVDYLRKRYEGTRLGRQELHAQILDDVPGALWNRLLIEQCIAHDAPVMKRVVVAVDPATTSNPDTSNETGILVCGLGEDEMGYVMSDRSLVGTPDEWARAAIAAYYTNEADRIIVEDNQGGEMVEYTLHTIDQRVRVQRIRAKRGKYLRAEPVAALYEQGRVKHVGVFPKLEDEMCTWVPGEDSPDHLDAMVHGLTELMLGAPATLEFSGNPFFK